MFKKLQFLTTFILLLSLASNTFAANVTWDNNNGIGNRMWDSALNWTGDQVPTDSDSVIIDDLYTDAANGPIIQAGIDAVCDTLAMGQSDSPSVEAVLTMTGGTLTTGGDASIGDSEIGDYKFDLSDGTVTIGGIFALGYAWNSNVTFTMDGGSLSTVGDLFLGVASSGTSNPTVNINGGNVVIAEDIELAEYAAASGTINISGGTVEVDDNIYVGWEQTGPATFNMTGGTVTSGIVTGDWIYVGGGYATNCYVNLDGGTLIAPGISLYPDVSLNISEGTLIVDGDYITVPNGWIWDPVAEDWNATLASPGVVSVYGTSNYGIIDDANYPAELGKRAILLIDYNVTNPGRTTVRADAIDADLAWNEKPLSGSTRQPQEITLSWSPGLNATAHDVYFGTNFDDVSNGTGGTFIDRYAVDANSYSPPETLVLDTTYYWRVDEVNSLGLPEWTGLVWNFKVAPGIALDPHPADGTSDASPSTLLSWTPGIEAVSHELYFSTDFNDVNERLMTPETPGANTYDPGPLEFSTTYYWAVDEVNLAADVTTWYGDLWQFTTASHVDVDNFESYVIYVNDIFDTWLDYHHITTGAILEINTDQAYARDGNSMLFEYNNTRRLSGNVYGSWADANTVNLLSGSDWTIGGAKALWMVFYGDPDNSATVNDKMYVALNDGTNVHSSYYPDVNDINDGAWYEWHIDLEDFNAAGVDLENVLGISIGFGTYKGSVTPGGTGTVYFDDIELWPPYCRTELFPADITGNCVADGYDLEVMANDWLIQDYNFIAEVPAEANLIGWWKLDEGTGTFTEDSSVYENDGNIIEASWTTGYPGDPFDSALAFDGDGVVYFDHVVCAEREGNTPGTYPAELMPDTFTVSCWAKLDSFSYFSSFVGNGIDTGADECGFFFYNYGWEGDNGSDFGLAIRTETAMSYVETENIYDTGTWYHLATTYDGNYASVYVDGLLAAGPTDVGGPMRWISEDSDNYPERFTIGVWLDVGYSLYIQGTIDDVRYYNYPMNQGEIIMLADPVEPGTEMYQPVPSPANLADPEPQLSRKVNFVDYAILADSWLVEQLWP